MTERQIKVRAALYTFIICVFIAVPFIEGLIFNTCIVLVLYLHAIMICIVFGLIYFVYLFMYEAIKDAQKERQRKEKEKW